MPLAQHRDPGCAHLGFHRYQAELLELAPWPTPVPLGRLAHQQQATHLQQGSSTLGDHCRAGEGPGDDTGVAPAMAGVPAQLFRPSGDHAHPMSQTQLGGGRGQEGRPGGVGVEQDPRRARTITGQHQARDPTATAEVERPPRVLAFLAPPVREERPGVVDVRLHRSRAQEPPPSSGEEHLDQPIIAASGAGAGRVEVNQRGRPA